MKYKVLIAVIVAGVAVAAGLPAIAETIQSPTQASLSHVAAGASVSNVTVSDAHAVVSASSTDHEAVSVVSGVNSDVGTQQAAWQFTVEGSENKARYRVRERLAGRELDNDAVGETTGLKGSVSVDANGKVLPGASQFTADLTLLKSDADRRDNYVRRNILVTDSFPVAVLRVTEVKGLPSPLPATGSGSIQLLGELTVKGVTRPTVWDATGSFDGTTLKGTAKTRFTFAEFSLRQPRVPIVLSVADTITLEYDFVMTRHK